MSGAATTRQALGDGAAADETGHPGGPPDSTGASRPLLRLRGVGMRYGRFDALAGIDLDLPAAGVVAILGGNGAGKTTVLRLLAGAAQPTTGHIEWSGAARPRVALVAQSVALYPFLTVRENCIAAGRMEGLRRSALRTRAEAAIGQALAGAARDRPVGELSGGTQRRAAIAAALMGDAPLVILDEPTTGLDAQARDGIVAICRSLRLAGKTVVLATHDFGLADAVAETVVFLRGGKIVAAGAPGALCRSLFGRDRRLVILPAAAPDAAQAALLASLGAAPAGEAEGDALTLFSPLDAHGLPMALSWLRDAGLPLREIRISEPGTAELFRRYCAAGGRPAAS